MKPTMTTAQPIPVTPPVGAQAATYANAVHGRKIRPRSASIQFPEKASDTREVKSQTNPNANRGPRKTKINNGQHIR